MSRINTVRNVETTPALFKSNTPTKKIEYMVVPASLLFIYSFFTVHQSTQLFFYFSIVGKVQCTKCLDIKATKFIFLRRSGTSLATRCRQTLASNTNYLSRVSARDQQFLRRCWKPNGGQNQCGLITTCTWHVRVRPKRNKNMF